MNLVRALFTVFIRSSFQNCIQAHTHKKDSVVKFPHYLIVDYGGSMALQKTEK